MRERQSLAGRLRLELRDAAGRVVHVREIDNHIVAGGRNLVARLFAGALTGLPTIKIQVGEGGKEVTDADNALLSKADEAIVRPENIRVEDAQVTLSAVLAEREKTQALVEAGVAVQIAGEAEVLYNRVVFPVLNKTPNMQLTLVWKIDFGRSE